MELSREPEPEGDSSADTVSDVDADDADDINVSETIRLDAPGYAFPKRIGQYELLRIVGIGGMGVVYEARQQDPERIVALKILKQGIVDRSILKRFAQESQLLAQMSHPGIAQMFDAGSHDEGFGGLHYYVLEFVPGAKPITDFADANLLSTNARLGLFAEVCEAVQYAHVCGVIHRDLKPANILVNAAGHPKIIDFGVARATDSEIAVTTFQTDVGQIIGTLQYMSPEQCGGLAQSIDARADVYSLGVILYELLTGVPPYDLTRAAIFEASRIICQELPKPPSDSNRALPPALDEIVLKAVAKSSQDRFSTVAEFRQAVLEHWASQQIPAPPTKGGPRSLRTVNRDRIIKARKDAEPAPNLRKPEIRRADPTRRSEPPAEWMDYHEATMIALRRLRAQFGEADVQVNDLADKLSGLRRDIVRGARAVEPGMPSIQSRMEDVVRSVQVALARPGRYTISIARHAESLLDRAWTVYLTAAGEAGRSTILRLRNAPTLDDLRGNDNLRLGRILAVTADRAPEVTSDDDVWEEWAAGESTHLALWAWEASDAIPDERPIGHLLVPLAVGCWESESIRIAVSERGLHLQSRLRSGTIRSLLR